MVAARSSLRSQKRWSVQRTSHAIVVSVIAAACAILLGPRANAQPTSRPDYCLWRGVASVKGPHRYMPRNDWCEGLYAKLAGEVGRVTLSTVQRAPLAMHERDRPGSTPTPARSVLLSWIRPAEDSVWLLAESTDPNIFYRMSSRRLARDGSFNWPLDIAESEGLEPSNLAALAWILRRFGMLEDTVYLPLAVSPNGDAVPNSDSAVAVVIPSVPLRDVKVHVGVVGADGNVTHWLGPERPISPPYHDRDEPIEVSLPRIARDSVLRVSLIGKTVSGAPVPFQFLVQGVTP